MKSIGTLVIASVFSCVALAAQSPLARLKAHAEQKQSNEFFRIERDLKPSYEGLIPLVEHEDYAIHYVDLQDGSNQKIYLLTSSISDQGKEWGVEYMIAPACAHCENRLEQMVQLMTDLRHGSAGEAGSTWYAHLPSWQATTAVVVAAWFGAQYYRTKNVKYAMVSVASLGMLFVCPCNGRVRFGVCPQKLQSALVFAVGAAGAALAMLLPAQMEHPERPHQD